MNTVTAGARTVSGTVNSGGAAVAGVYVFAGGYAKDAVTTDVSGNYTISGLPNNDAFEISAYKGGYCGSSRFEPIGTSNLTAINFNLNAGECGFSGGGGGPDGGKPHVVFSGPPEFAGFVPLEENIRVGIDQPLNPATVNDTDPTNVGSNIYLTTDDGTTKIAGSVVYCANNSAPGCSSLFPGDQNVIFFSPSADLTTNTFYTLVITEAVVSESGQSIEGNRPGGGHQLSFSTGGGAVTFDSNTFGTGGAFMPPFVESMTPAPGISIAPNSKIVLAFNETMDTTTLTTNNLKLFTNAGNPVTITVSVDNNSKKIVTLTPSSSLSAGEYQVRVLGGVANASGVAMRPPVQASEIAFSGNFNVSGANDNTAPTIYPMTQDNASNVPVNQGFFEYGFNEALDINTIDTTNITMQRGSSSTAISVKYEPGINSVFVMPTTVLAPNTTYTVTFGTGVTDLAGQALAVAQSYSFTTGSADTSAPNLKEARCDEYSCEIFFTEPMNSKTQADGSSYDNSVLKKGNYTIGVETAPGSGTFGADIIGGSSASLSYDPVNFSVRINNIGLSSTDRGKKFLLTVNAAVKDLSGNNINTGSNANTYKSTFENSAETFGSFGGGGMFGPPTTFFGDGGSGAGEFKPEGFGSFTGEQFAFGQADMAFPFNPMAGQDSNVFQVRFSPGVALQDNDQIVLTFPNGTTITNAEPDSFSPFKNDLNEFAAGVITFDTALDTDGIAVDSSAKTVTVQLGITGSPGMNDPVTIDLRKIINPSIPKGPDTGGYTVGIKIKRGAEVIANKTSMPYFIQAGGTNNITVKVYAGSSDTPVNGANGNVFMFGGGPGGPMNKNLTLTNGVVTAADGTAIAGDAGVQFTNLPDGCYFFGTDPMASLGGVDYLGQTAPEPVCVNGGQSTTKNIVLASSAGGATVALTVKLAGINDFGGADIDVFGGGPNNFAVKTLDDVGAPDAGGYTLRLRSNGNWFVGVGPAMPKGGTSKIPDPLPGVAPPPANLLVSGLGDSPTISAVNLPPGVTFNSGTNTLTFTFATADKAISGTVTDGTDPLANIEVFVHSQGFGAPTFAKTKSDGTFTINVSDYGNYEIGAFKDGLPPRFDQIEVKPDGADAGNDIDIFFKGKQITGGNPLVIKLKKPSYYISGKVLDASNNPISYAPVFASDGSGNFVNGMTSADGSYTVFVDAGTWTVKSELPPDKTDTCGTFSKSVTVTNENKTSQNITPTAGTCYTLSGTVTIAGSTQANIPVFVEEWDTINDRPAGGLFKPTSTNSSGVYQVKVAGNKTYRIGTWDPNYGELSVTQAVATADVTNAHLNSGATGTVTFAFTGGTSSQEAFVEIKKSDDKHTRVGKNQKDLSSNLTFTVKQGTYDYFINVFGVGNFSGTVATGSTATIDLSSSDMITLSGNVKDDDGNNLSGVLVSVKDTDTGLVQTAKTDENGDYAMEIKEGSYVIGDSLAGYVPGEAPAQIAITADVTHDFGPVGDQEGLIKADDVIVGTIMQSDGSTPVNEGFVTATNAEGVTIAAAIDPQNGTYSLPVTDGTWTVKAVAPLSDETTKAGTVTVSGNDVTNQNITMEADAQKTSETESKALAANTGGSINDMDATGIKFTAGSGVLESGSGNVTVTVEKTFTAPDTNLFQPLGDAAFGISASGSGTIKNLNGMAEIQIDYSDFVAQLPDGVAESDLKLAYFSPETGEYVPVEGGFTIDADNNTISGQVDHLTDFALVFANGDAPETPGNLAATAVSPYQVNLSWTAVDGATGYNIFRDTDQNGDFPRIGADPTVSSGNTTTYSDTGLSAGTRYYYKISAINNDGESAASSAISKTTQTVSSSSGSSGSGSSGAISYSNSKLLQNNSEASEQASTAQSKSSEKNQEVTKFDDTKTHWAKNYIDDLYSKSIISGYSEKSFKPNNNITRAEFTKIVLKALNIAVPEAASVKTMPFKDVKKDDWYIGYMQVAKEKNIMKGYKDKTVKPNNPITRAEAVKILLEAAKIQIDTTLENKFADLKANAWYTAYINTAVEKGLVSGREDGTFAPDAQLTRAEAAKIVSLLLQKNLTGDAVSMLMDLLIQG